MRGAAAAGRQAHAPATAPTAGDATRLSGLRLPPGPCRARVRGDQARTYAHAHSGEYNADRYAAPSVAS